MPLNIVLFVLMKSQVDNLLNRNTNHLLGLINQVVVQHLRSVHPLSKALERRKAVEETLIQMSVVVVVVQVELGLITMEQMRVMVELACKVQLLEPQFITQVVAVVRAE